MDRWQMYLMAEEQAIQTILDTAILSKPQHERLKRLPEGRATTKLARRFLLNAADVLK